MKSVQVCACGCGASLTGMRADAVYHSPACRKRAERERRRDKGVTPHPLQTARTEQEARKLNRDLGALIRELIIDRLSRPPYQVHADDLEDYFPIEHRERCRKLAPAQFGGLAGAGHIHGVEYRKSLVPARKGAKSWVYEFTRSGREKFVGVGAGAASKEGADASGLTGAVSQTSPDPGDGSAGERKAPPTPQPPVEPARPPHEPLELLPPVDPEAWAA